MPLTPYNLKINVINLNDFIINHHEEHEGFFFIFAHFVLFVVKKSLCAPSNFLKLMVLF
jgi:hypothetical protein